MLSRGVMDFQLTADTIKASLDCVAKVDEDVRRALDAVGYPDERRNVAGFPTFARIIAGQQLSVKAAATIVGRLHDLVGDPLSPRDILNHSFDELRSVGLSGQKVNYLLGLAEAVTEKRFLPDALPAMSDDEALASITALKGFGRWSAEMYLMFSLGRPDVWPADDLAVREAVRKMKGLDARPATKAMDRIAEPWRPHRSSVALFLWHFYKNAPLD